MVVMICVEDEVDEVEDDGDIEENLDSFLELKLKNFTGKEARKCLLLYMTRTEVKTTSVKIE
jgi:hypothetical protein